MPEIVPLVAVMGAGLCWFLCRSFFNPITITLTLFGVSAYLASLQLFGLYDFPQIAYDIVLVGCLAILGGGILASVGDLSRTYETPQYEATPRRRFISYRLANVLVIIAIVVLFVTRAAVLGVLLAGGGFDAVRSYYLGYGGNLGFVGTTDELLNRVVVSPVLFAGVPLLIYGWVVGPPNRLFTRLMIVAIILNLATSGGRIIFVFAAVQLFALLAVAGRGRFRVSRKRLALIASVLAVVVVAVTVWRGNALFYEVYTYLAIPMPLLGHWATQMDAVGVSTNGLSFIYGFVTLIANAASAFGESIATVVAGAVNAPQDTWVMLLPDRPFNAFVTMFYYFYVDFGMLGVGLFSFTYGFVTQHLFVRARRTADVRTVLVFLLAMQAVASSFVRWAGTDGAYVLALLLLLVLTRRPSNSPRVQDSRAIATGRSAFNELR